jgi:hypothetical protein
LNRAITRRYGALWNWWRYHLAYRADVGTRTFSFPCTLPSKRPALDFQAEAHVTYRVTNPKAIIQRMITDAGAVLEPLLIKLMRAESRKYELKECDIAEKQLSEAIKNYRRLDNFEITNFVVALSVDEDEREHVRRMRVLEREHEFDVQNVRYRKVAEEEHAQLRKKLIERYGQLTAMDLEQLLLDLAERPDELRSGLEILNQHFSSERQHWVTMLNLLREANAIEPQHFKDLRDYILKRYPDIDRKRLSLNGSQSTSNGNPPGSNGSQPAANPGSNGSKTASTTP